MEGEGEGREGPVPVKVVKIWDARIPQRIHLRSASSLGTLNGAMERRGGSRSAKGLIFGGFSSYLNTSAFSLCQGASGVFVLCDGIPSLLRK